MNHNKTAHDVHVHDQFFTLSTNDGNSDTDRPPTSTPNDENDSVNDDDNIETCLTTEYYYDGGNQGIPSSARRNHQRHVVEYHHDQATTTTSINPQDENNGQSREELPISLWLQQNFTLLEISGSCGDFGTLLPLLVALARQRAIYLSPTLLLTGLVHIITGYVFNIPIPLQPMKAISALGISQELSREQVTTSGICMGITFLLFQYRGVIDFIHKIIPNSVIGGLQLGVGWKLSIKGITMIQNLPWWFFTNSNLSFDCITLSILCSVLCLYWLRPRNQQHRRRLLQRHESDIISTTSDSNSIQQTFCDRMIENPPVGIYLFGLGIVLASIKLATDTSTTMDSTTTAPNAREPLVVNALRGVTWEDWKLGLFDGALAQLPLSTLNSCLSVCLLAQTLYGSNNRGGGTMDDNNNATNDASGRSQQQKTILSRRSVCLSIGLMNTVLCPLGMMPTCHGAGGLAGQHKLGAKSGVSMVCLGIFKIIMSFIAHYGYLLPMLDALPASILGVLLVLAGHELAVTGVMQQWKSSATQGHGAESASRSEIIKENVTICLVTGLVIVGTGHTHVGALCGWITYMVHGSGFQELILGRSHSTTPSQSNDTGYNPLEQQQSLQSHDDDTFVD